MKKSGLSCHRDIRDDRQMIRQCAGGGIGPHVQEGGFGAAIDAVESEKGKPRWKGALPASGRQPVCENLADRSDPEPIIEISHNHGGDGLVSDEVEQRSSLASPLSDA